MKKHGFVFLTLLFLAAIYTFPSSANSPPVATLGLTKIDTKKYYDGVNRVVIHVHGEIFNMMKVAWLLSGNDPGFDLEISEEKILAHFSKGYRPKGPYKKPDAPYHNLQEVLKEYTNEDVKIEILNSSTVLDKNTLVVSFKFGFQKYAQGSDEYALGAIVTSLNRPSLNTPSDTVYSQQNAFYIQVPEPFIIPKGASSSPELDAALLNSVENVVSYIGYSLTGL